MRRVRIYRPFLFVFIAFSLLSTLAKTTIRISANVQAQVKETITQIALGGWHSSALSESGRFFTWGYNGNGQLGNGSGNDSNKPLSIANKLNLNTGETVVQSSFGYNHSAILTSNDRLFTWGRNDYGQVGDGTTSHQYNPVDITSKFNLVSGEKIAFISLGSNHSAALTSNHRVFLWGLNQHGELGNNATTNLSMPTDVTSSFVLIGDEKIEKVLLGEFHSAAFSSTNRVFFWGMNTIGQLGDNSTTNRLTPTDITSRFNLHGGESVINLCLGGSHSAAFTSENRVFTWGNNVSGQLGDGTNQGSLVPIDMTSHLNLALGERITHLSLRGGTSFALTSASRVLAWGDNGFGQLGDGTSGGKLLPIDITSWFGLDIGETITQVSLGLGHSAVLTSQGRLITWGRNTFGQLGHGSNSDTNIPMNLEILVVEEENPGGGEPTPTDASWAWWFLLLLLIPIGYLSYRYREKLSSIFKKTSA